MFWKFARQSFSTWMLIGFALLEGLLNGFDRFSPGFFLGVGFGFLFADFYVVAVRDLLDTEGSRDGR